MLECFIVRHAITAENLDYTLIGRTDVPLHPLGRIQAHLLADYLKSVSFDAIFSSPLQRALETARCIAKFQNEQPVQTAKALQEINLGIVDGLSSFTAYEKYKAVMDEALDPLTNDFAFPKGESRLHAFSRFRRWILALARRYPDGKICIVTHGGMIGLLLTHLEGLPLGQFRTRQPHHASVTKVALTANQMRLLSYNDCTHLTAKVLSAIEKARHCKP